MKTFLKRARWILFGRRNYIKQLRRLDYAGKRALLCNMQLLSRDDLIARDCLRVFINVECE